MDLIYRNAEIEAELDRARSFADTDQALHKLKHLAKTFEPIRGKALFAPGLDRALVRLADRMKLSAKAPPKSNDNICIITTRIYHVGGHTRLTADIARLVGAASTTLIFTDAYNVLRYGQLMRVDFDKLGMPNHAAVMLSSQTMMEKIGELHAILSAIRPTRIFLMTHHMDPVGVVATWPFRDIVDFVHHGDHQPALGVTLPFSAHADPTYTCHQACKAHQLPAQYVGMTVEGAQALPAAPPDRTGRPLRIATCATSKKYLHPARHRWADFAIAALKAQDCEILHIGDQDPEFTVELNAALTAAGVDPARYRFVGLVPDLRQALIDMEVDVVLGSYPYPGGKVSLDAMAAGLAPIVPVVDDLGPLLQIDIPLKYWFPIAEPDQVAEAIPQVLALSRELRTDAGRAELNREFDRFERYVRMEPTAAPMPGHG